MSSLPKYQSPGRSSARRPLLRKPSSTRATRNLEDHLHPAHSSKRLSVFASTGQIASSFPYVTVLFHGGSVCPVRHCDAVVSARACIGGARAASSAAVLLLKTQHSDIHDDDSDSHHASSTLFCLVLLLVLLVLILLRVLLDSFLRCFLRRLFRRLRIPLFCNLCQEAAALLLQHCRVLHRQGPPL
ncbi:hypothetical protein BBAD15_g5934 [Beauveria bassiana D1-5]|uniref:Uncharacterized protein n=1 Tax=Beauveria bassiana D1-5 TaxID=1245745 RepID=A0A0A2VQW7_BEABA|nr:hypothetical protein BBAD15_g5934 [Beauveria bassiana D1-5]